MIIGPAAITGLVLVLLAGASAPFLSRFIDWVDDREEVNVRG